MGRSKVKMLDEAGAPMTAGQTPGGELGMTDEQLNAIGQWVFETCILFGTTLVTAYLVSALFVQGVDNANKKRELAASRITGNP